MRVNRADHHTDQSQNMACTHEFQKMPIYISFRKCFCTHEISLRSVILCTLANWGTKGGGGEGWLGINFVPPLVWLEEICKWQKKKKKKAPTNRVTEEGELGSTVRILLLLYLLCIVVHVSLINVTDLRKWLTPSVNHFTLETSERGGSVESEGTISVYH